LVPIQQHLPPQTTTNVTEVNLITKQYFHDQGFPHFRKTSNDLSTSNLPYSFHRFLSGSYPSQYCTVSSNMIPTNILPMTCSSTLPDTIPTAHPRPAPADIKKARKKREKVAQSPVVKKLTDEQSPIFKSLKADRSATKKQRHMKSNPEDFRAKKELRRITHRNRLAVLKFMMRKQKRQKQERTSIPKLPDAKSEPEPVTPNLVSTPIVKPDKMEADLPDIIASSLRIFLDANQKVESISLYYHRRRKSDITNESPPISSANTDNKLGLLIEAVEFIETLHGSSKLAALPVK
jgi:hypothetical protein